MRTRKRGTTIILSDVPRLTVRQPPPFPPAFAAPLLRFAVGEGRGEGERNGGFQGAFATKGGMRLRRMNLPNPGNHRRERFRISERLPREARGG